MSPYEDEGGGCLICQEYEVEGCVTSVIMRETPPFSLLLLPEHVVTGPVLVVMKQIDAVLTVEVVELVLT